MLERLRIILLPFSWIYGSVTAVRNFLYDKGIFSTYDIPKKSICVGNLSVGGTGKTPHVAYLAKLLKEDFSTSILSRGYGRSTKGFLLAHSSSTAHEIGDEPRLYKTRFGKDIEVVVAESRKLGVKKIQKLFPANELILLDDAFQHRAVKAGKSILLMDYNAPFYSDHVLPAGNLREWKCGKNRADWLIVTKCPSDLTATQKKKLVDQLRFKAEKVFFSTICYGELVSFGSSNSIDHKNVLLVTGIANPLPLERELSKKYRVEKITFSDHHDFTLEDIQQIHQKFDTFASDQKAIITTEKDFMRLADLIDQTQIKSYPWFYQTIDVEIDRKETFINLVKQYVNTI